MEEKSLQKIKVFCIGHFYKAKPSNFDLLLQLQLQQQQHHHAAVIN